MNNERPNYSQLIKELRNEYNNLKERVCSMNTFILDIDFEKQLPHPEEQRLMLEKYRSMLDYLNNLRRRIMFYEGQQLKKEPGLARIYRDDKGYLHAVLSDGRTIEIDKTHHCGQDADCDDACCQARGNKEAPCPVDDGIAVGKEVPDSIKSLEGMQIIKVCSHKCKDCPCGDGLREYPLGRDASSCVKVELVGGYTLCLSPLPNSIVTE